MKLKTYTAGTMAQALAEVKKDLGKDAVILHTRVYKQGAVMGVGGTQMVEITASDQGAAMPPRRTPPDELRPGPAARPTRPEPRPLVEPKPATPEVRVPTTRVDVAPVNDAALVSLREDLAAIRRLVGQALANSSNPGGPLQGPLAEVYARLRDDGLAPDLADRITAAVRADLTPQEQADPVRVSGAVGRRLASLVPCVGGITPGGRQPDGRPLTIALVGPTGVGKTTTIAKLAAAYKLRFAKRVGLVTCDTYRIAAVEQLRTYAGIIAVPLRVALTDADVAEACRGLAECDVVILDTPGRSQHDSSRLDELAACVKAAAPHETHLVLSAGVAPPVLSRAASLFTRVKPDRIILTKLDEAVNFGPMVNVLRDSALRASYFTTGQEVPDQIEVATPGRLAALVLGGAVSPVTAPRALAEAVG
ncbi:MAG: flagellar biosynthesis protein FlhF [Phycisphaerae bacterium]|nr:MAG: flagellar biosynthesis protein FlhF [Phycisphaerae bacterium]